MKKRTVTAIIMLACFIPLLIIGKLPFLILCMGLSYLAGYELVKTLAINNAFFKHWQYSIPLLNVFSGVLYYYNINYGYLFSLFVVLILLVFMLSKKVTSKDVAFLILTYFYSGMMFTLVMGLRFFGEAGQHIEGLYLFIWLIVITISTDTGAYLIGSKWGKHHISPLISPKKTVEGSIGGLISGTICSFSFYLVIKNVLNINIFGSFLEKNQVLHHLAVLAIIMVLSCVGQIGDLIASKIKRDFNIKDYSQIFPGHGGVLDRFDSLLYAGSLLFLILGIIL